MKDIFSEIVRLTESQQDFTLATVLDTWRSAPRPPGSTMAVTESGKMIGSVSGGCVEKSVVQKSLKILDAGGSEELTFGVSNEDAWEVGLSCGGAISVHISKFFGTQNPKMWEVLSEAMETNMGTALIIHLDNDEHSVLGPDGDFLGFLENLQNNEILTQINRVVNSGLSQVIETENSRFFVQNFPKKPRMLLIGSAHITSELLLLAHLHNFETIVIDPRDTFAHNTIRSQEPDQLFVKWPEEVLPDLNLDQNCFAVILSHDPKIDDSALTVLLKKKVAYIGALGSRKTHAKRVDRLISQGFSESDISRIHAPIGLDLGALLPGEIAISVMAEVIKTKNNLSRLIT